MFDWFRTPASNSGETGQYMVEFGLTFIFFIFFVIFVIDIGLLIYNHNVFYRGVVKSARTAALGGSNAEIDDTLSEKAVNRYFPGIFSRATVDTYQIRPEKEIQRVHGTEVTVAMNTTFGIYLLGVVPVTLDMPIKSSSMVSQGDDQDRDGCKDSREGSGVSCKSYDDFDTTFPRDHDNDGSGDEFHVESGTDTDADNDGGHWGSDTVAIAYFSGTNCGQGYWIARPNNTATASTTCSFKGLTWEKEWFDGWYHSAEHWADDSEARWRIFPRRLPNFSVKNSSDDFIIRILRTDHDRDNDGWSDKYDRKYDAEAKQYAGDLR